MMKQLPGKERAHDEKRAVYEAPAIVYEGVIGTRAGSPLGHPTGSDDIDPADLFD
ncbi:MAG: hypothetical protein GY803_06630 [Chloroflexi bacterium]|nr:hypothetical protein [Chloroflexota bacterium]